VVTPTRIYAKQVQKVLENNSILGISHITGGGFIENIPRALPEGLAASINVGAWDVPPIFDFLGKHGNIAPADMYGVFNMGIGMMLIVDASEADAIVATLNSMGEKASIVGTVIPKTDQEVVFNG